MVRRDGDARVPVWGLISATSAPLLLIGGWMLAASLQRAGFDQVTGTISALAARDADHRWVMTTALAGTGIAHLVTALAIRPAAAAGRIVLALGGVATVLVAAAPLPAGDGSSQRHALAAGIAFAGLAVWPALASAAPTRHPAPGGTVPAWPWRRMTALLAAGVLLVPLTWFFVELLGGGDRVGLAERVTAGSQALWPLVAVVADRR